MRDSDPVQPLWTPAATRNQASCFLHYLGWLKQHRGLRFAGYHDAWQWSTTHIEQFWQSLWEYFDVQATRPYSVVLTSHTMPGADWFVGAHLNYAQHAFRHATRTEPAIFFRSETRPLTTLTWHELHAQVASVADALREMGVARGDRVAALLPNVPEAVIAFLACASIGAVWSSCSPEFGADSVSERFRQIEPKVLIAIDGYVHAGKSHDRRTTVGQLRTALPSVMHTVLVTCLDEHARVAGTHSWPDLLGRNVALQFESLPFDHPLWVLFSSGTTGPPKAIVHGHGGILLEHLKALVIQNDMKRGDRFFWYTTTSWMMWNVLASGLLAGCSLVLYDGSPLHPDPHVLWRLAEETRVTRFGAGASYYLSCMKANLRPAQQHDLTALRAIGSTGSPLPPEAFHWVYEHIKRDVWLASSSGGTDVATAFVGGCPLLPVYAGELQGAALGVRAEAFDEQGAPVVEEVGELVIREPLPSMPLGFWNDSDGARYRSTYFDTWPGVWRHGDLIRFTTRGSAIIYGRSDATLNRHGVRMGASEIYRAAEAVPGVVDSLVVGLELPGGEYRMLLFVQLAHGIVLDTATAGDIRQRIRTMFTPRHVPDEIVQAPAIPRTHNGKKLEVPIKRILLGARPEEVLDEASLANPESLPFFLHYAQQRAT